MTSKIVILKAKIVKKKRMIVMEENRSELMIQDTEAVECESDGSKSLLAIIVLFLIFRHFFHGWVLALIFAYILAPRKKENKITEE